MTTTSRQRAAMAAIVVLGLAASAAVLWSGRAPHGVGQTAREPHADHADHAGSGPAVNPPRAATAAGTLRLTSAQMQAAGIVIAGAGPALLQASLQFQGEIRLDDDRTAHVVPRLAGVAERIAVNLGQQVAKGAVLAVIASSALADQRSELLTAHKRRELARATHARELALWQDRISAEQDLLQARNALDEAEIAVQAAAQKLAAVGATALPGGASPASNLARFEVRAPFAGTVVEKHLSLGESVKEDASIFTVSDLGSLWAEFAVAPRDLAQVRVGQRVVVSSSAFDARVQGRVASISTLLGEQTRSATARVVLADPGAAWRPGLFVTVAVQGDAVQAAVAVSADAVQTIDGRPGVFVAVPGGFAARSVQTGRADGKSVEILAGLQPGERYAAANSFVLKAELGKAGAAHTH